MNMQTLLTSKHHKKLLHLYPGCIPISTQLNYTFS